MGIGLHPGTVGLDLDHRRWQLEFRRAQHQIVSSLAHISSVVEHVGSSAVPGLVAKPIVDIAIGTETEQEIPSVIRELTPLGYRYFGYRDDSGGHILDFIQDGLCTRLLHVVEIRSTQWRRYVLLRDYLRASESARRRYQRLKIGLASQFPSDRKGYTAAKAMFVDALFAEALRSHRKQGDSGYPE